MVILTPPSANGYQSNKRKYNRLFMERLQKGNIGHEKHVGPDPVPAHSVRLFGSQMSSSVSSQARTNSAR
jgi:hypothetical protein